MEDWAEIRRLHRAEQMPVRAIARNTVCRAIADDAAPKYRRAPKGSIVDAVEPQIRELLRQWPEMPATVIAERIGWDRGLTVLKDRGRDLRPPDLAEAERNVGRREPQVTLADLAGLIHRPRTARMLLSRSAADLIAGHCSLLTELGAVPRVLVWDNEGDVGSWRTGGPH